LKFFIGEKSLEIKILADRNKIPLYQIKSNQLSRKEIIEQLLNSGVWPFIRQRPYGI
jgi:Na+-transporting NADH:ubiquinone oxidoreductase subunit A